MAELSTSKRIAVIGGGAAGLMAAATLLEESRSLGKEGVEVHLFEKNRILGMKVSISGGGRCNVTTGIDDRKKLLSKYIRGGKFLKPALAAFSPANMRTWVESHDVPVKIEADKRAFPASDRGKDIVDMFQGIFRDRRMHVHYLEPVVGIEQNKSDGGQFQVRTKVQQYAFDAVILTTGGNAYGHTGSSGDGYAFAKAFGHTISELGPSLNSFETVEGWCGLLSGISFEKAKFRVVLRTGESKEVVGPMLFTHFGISGPTTFALAAEVAFEVINSQTPLEVAFIPLAQSDFADWSSRIQQGASTAGAKLLVNSLAEVLPRKFAATCLELTGVPAERKAAELTKAERNKLCHLLSGQLKLTLKARRAGDEFVTAGGVELSEVEAKTLRSKINPNLYFAGEILNIDGLTGGFNLQAAWSTGRLAAIGTLNSF